MKYVESLFAVCALTGVVSGQTVLMDQIGSMDGASVDANVTGSQYFEAAYSTYSLATLDNFTLTSSNTIGVVEAVVDGWNGFTDPSTITAYQANIYTNPTAASFDLIGDVASATVDAADATLVADWQGSGYLVSFQTSMYLDSGDYWVSVIPRNDYEPNGQTGIDGSLIGDGTYAWQANPGGAFKMPNNMQEMTSEAAFRLFDDVVPDPCNSPLPTECTSDVDGDLIVAVSDVLAIIGNWGVCGDGTFRPIGDISPLPNGDCCVDVSDVLAVIGSWGQDCLPRGACCSNTAGCTDNQLQEECVTSGGMYLGDDSLCSDGECVDGACCIDESTCQDGTAMWVCDVLGGIFRGSGSTCATVSCTSGCNATGCQSPDLEGHGSSGTIGATSDTNPGAGYRVADTFRPTASGAITEACWWGIYIDFGTSTDCGASGPGTGDNFTITYYLDDGDSTIPGTAFAGPFSVSSSVAPTGDVIPSGIGDIVQYQYSAYHPPVKVQADACYWISIVNETTADCYWLWQTAPEGDGRSAQDNGGWGTNDFDLGFCVNIDITSDGCGAFVGPCCLADLSCQIMSAGSCATAEGTYGGDNLTCGDVNNCQPIPGACCFDADACLDNLTDVECGAFGGTFAGEDTLCADGACVPPEPDGCTFQWSDDELELNIGVGGSTLVWGVPMSFADCDTLTTVIVQWGTTNDGSTLDGADAYIVISQDPNGDGNPLDAIVLSCTPVVVKNSASGQWVSYEITPTDVTAGTVHVSCSMLTTAVQFPMGLDNTSGSAENSWTGFGFSDLCDPWSDNGATYGVIDDLAATLAGNWMIGTPPQQP